MKLFGWKTEIREDLGKCYIQYHQWITRQPYSSTQFHAFHMTLQSGKINYFGSFQMPQVV